jgi:hypothetical protein
VQSAGDICLCRPGFSKCKVSESVQRVCVVLCKVRKYLSVLVEFSHTCLCNFSFNSFELLDKVHPQPLECADSLVYDFQCIEEVCLRAAKLQELQSSQLIDVDRVERPAPGALSEAARIADIASFRPRRSSDPSVTLPSSLSSKSIISKAPIPLRVHDDTSSTTWHNRPSLSTTEPIGYGDIADLCRSPDVATFLSGIMITCRAFLRLRSTCVHVLYLLRRELSLVRYDMVRIELQCCCCCAVAHCSVLGSVASSEYGRLSRTAQKCGLPSLLTGAAPLSVHSGRHFTWFQCCWLVAALSASSV